MATARPTLGERLPDRATLAAGALWLNTLVVLAAVYYVGTDAAFAASAFHLRPLVYLAVGGLAAYAVTPREGTARERRVAAAVAGGYFLLLAVANGIVSPGHALVGADVPGSGWRLSTVVPFGFGPAVLYDGRLVILALQPATLVGYAALSYLVYATVLDASEVAVGGYVGGVLGLFTCISCTWAVLAPLVGGAAGATALAAVGETQHAVAIATYVVTVGLLAWRPLR